MLLNDWEHGGSNPPASTTSQRKEKAMTETIKSITKSQMDDSQLGYTITTDKQTIEFGIDNVENCCE
jgi:hypothetical protein